MEGGTLNTVNVWLQRDLVSFGPVSVRLANLLFVAFTVGVAVVASRLFRRWTAALGSRGAAANRPAFYAIGRIGHYLIVLVAILVVLQAVGLNLSSLTVAAGAIGLGVGLGLQSVVNNFVSGLLLLFERSVKVGDFIALENGLQGTVQSINVRSTVITTNDNLSVVVPNSFFTDNILTNWTMNDASRRIHVPFGVAFGTDEERVKSVVLEAAARVEHYPGDGLNPPQVWLVGFGESSLDFELVVWVGSQAVHRPGNTRARYLW